MTLFAGILPKTKQCPRCERTRKAEFFDTRYVSGSVKLQSWCRDCRREGKKETAPKAKAAPKVKKSVSEDMADLGLDPTSIRVTLTEVVGETREVYRREFPNDRLADRRPWKHMIAKLVGKLGADGVTLTDEAKAKYKGAK